MFHCVARCEGVIWLINDTIAGVFSELTTSTETHFRLSGEESLLSITATVSANNSIIKCAVEDWNNNLERQSTPGALLQVQGKLTSIILYGCV